MAESTVTTAPVGFLSHDGVSMIKGIEWKPAEVRGRKRAAPRGVVLIVHGMVEHVGRYDEFARFLAQRGFVVCAADHIGHGKSVSSLDDLGCLPVEGKEILIEDVHELRKTVTARYSRQTPCILFGHSMGSFIVRAYLARHGEGLSGAALATIISQFLSFILLFVGARVSGCIPIRLRSVAFTPMRLKEIAGGGLPSLFRQGLGSVATMTLNIVANPYGDAAIAAMSVVSRVVMFANSALIGFGQGFQPVCGFNYGAKKYSRVLEAFWFCVKISSVLLLVLSAAGLAFAPQIIGIFRDDPQVIEIGALTLRLQCITFPLGGWIVMNNMMMQTMGKTLYASTLAASRQGLFFIPALLILPLIFDLLGVQMAQAVSDVFTFAVTTILYVRVAKELKLPDENPANSKT